MNLNLPNGTPDFLFESKELADAFAKKTLTPSQLRANQVAQEARAEINKEFLNGVNGLSFYYSQTAPSDEQSPISFDRHFNPVMKHDSAYFSAVNNMTSCVERNLDNENACANEMRALRKTAFEGELLYHNVNKRFYMSLLNVKKHEAPYWFI